MKVRGERECRDCGARWSYYETGSVDCPACGSLKSVGVEGRALHTDSPAEFDLTPHREAFGEARGTLPEEGVDDLKNALREYVRKRGFVSGGDLLELDGTYLAAGELLQAVDVYDRLRDPNDDDRDYLLALLADADAGERPSAGNVPEPMREARGMAAARAVGEYREDLGAFLDDAESPAEDVEDREDHGDDDPGSDDHALTNPEVAGRGDAVRKRLERLRDRTKRVEALNGDVSPETADALVDVANAIGEFLRTGEAAALERADERLGDADL